MCLFQQEVPVCHRPCWVLILGAIRQRPPLPLSLSTIATTGTSLLVQLHQGPSPSTVDCAVTEHMPRVLDLRLGADVA
jgi:hypothetical protein